MKKLVKAIAAMCLTAGVCFSFAACGEDSAKSVASPDGNSQYSIITKLDLNVHFDGNTAYATVKNSFTLFPATAKVYVYLYFSENYTTDYTAMQEVAENYIDDLDMNKSLTASYEMQGDSGYFLARMRYKIDSRNWEERTTDAYKHDYSGIFMQTIEDDGSLPVFEDVEPVVPFLLTSNGYEMINEEHLFYVGWSDDEISVEEFETENVKKFNETIGKEFFIFNPSKKDYNALQNTIYYTYYQYDNQYVLSKFMFIAASEFGFTKLPEGTIIEPTGLGNWNIRFSLKFINIEGLTLNGKLKLKFGGSTNHFINIYIGETCIGTCFYETETIKEVPYAFFYNLFAEGLRVI